MITAFPTRSLGSLLPADEALAPLPWRRRLARALERIAARIAEQRRLRHDLRALMGFDDRMLKDIGLERGQIEMAVRSGDIMPLQGFDRAAPAARPAPLGRLSTTLRSCTGQAMQETLDRVRGGASTQAWSLSA